MREIKREKMEERVRLCTSNRAKNDQTIEGMNGSRCLSHGEVAESSNGSLGRLDRTRYFHYLDQKM